MPKPLVFLNWFGGKVYLLDTIYPFPEHRTYVDVFGGGGSVLLNKIPSVREVYNDINDRLVNAFRTLQNHWMEFQFLAEYKGPLAARKLFEQFKEPSQIPLEDAVRLYYVCRHSYSGNMNQFGGVHTLQSQIMQRRYENGIKQFPKLHQRIKHILIEHQDFRHIFKRFDAPDTLFYVDPPYVQGGQEYEKMIGNDRPWTAEDLDDLCEILGSLEGKFVMSFDKKVVGSGWTYQKFQAANRANTRQTDARTTLRDEWVMRNFDPLQTSSQKPLGQKSLLDLYEVRPK